MAYTPEQLGAAYKAAMDAGDTAAANELATALNAAVGEPAAPAPTAPTPSGTAPITAPAPEQATPEQPKSTVDRVFNALSFGMQSTPERREKNEARAQEVTTELAPYAPLAVGALAAPIAGPALGLSALQTAGLGALSAGAGQAISSAMRGVPMPEFLAETATATALGPIGYTPTLSSVMQPAKTAMGAIGRTALSGAETAAQVYTGMAGAGAVGGAMRGEEFNLGDALANKEALLGASLAGLVGMGGAAGETVGRMYDSAERVKNMYASVGIDNPTLAMMISSDPSSITARAERRLIRSNSEFRQQVGEVFRRIGTGMEDVVSDTPRMDKIAAALEPYSADISKLDEQLQAARNAYNVANERYQATKQAVGTPTPQMIDEQQQALFQKVSAEAAMLDTLGTLAPDLIPLQKASDTVVDSLNSILGVKRERAQMLYAATGIDTKQPLFDANALTNAAKGAMQRLGEPSTQEEVLSLLANYRKEQPSGPQILLPSGKPVAAPAKQYTVEELREIKNYLAEKMTPPGGKLTTAKQKVINDAYAAMNAEAMRIVGQTYGDDAARALSEANAYNAKFSEAYNNPLLRQLENPDQRASVIQNIADSVARSDFSQFRAFNDLVKSVYDEYPSLAVAAAVPFQKAVRDAFLLSARNGTVVDIKRLANNLSFAAKEGRKYGFDAQKLGLGDPRTVDNWQKILSRRGIKDLTQDEANAFFTSPSVQKALSAPVSKAQTAILDRAATETAFLRKAQQAAALEAFGAMQSSPRVQALRAEAERLAGNKEGAQKLLESARRNPLTVAINNLRLAPDIASSSKAAQDVASKMSETILNSDPALAKQLSAALIAEGKRNPKFSQIPKMIETRLIKDALVAFEPSSVGAGSQLAFRQFADFFSPPPGQTNRLEALKQFVSPEKFSSLKTAARIMANAARYQREITLPAGIAESAVVGAGLARGMARTGTALPGSQENIFMSLLNRLVDTGVKSYHTVMTAAVVDDGFARKLVQNGGNISRALADVGPARAIALQQFVPEIAEAKTQQDEAIRKAQGQ